MSLLRKLLVTSAYLRTPLLRALGALRGYATFCILFA